MKLTIKDARPTIVHMTPPKRVDQIYKSDGSVPSLDFQLSVINQIHPGFIIITKPMMAKSIPSTSMIDAPF
jgi:hypothetical protein